MKEYKAKKEKVVMKKAKAQRKGSKELNVSMSSDSDSDHDDERNRSIECVHSDDLENNLNYSDEEQDVRDKMDQMKKKK
jgi:hypothetical protein